MDDGIRSIEHANFIDAKTAAYGESKRIIVTPNLVAYHGYTLPPFDSYLDDFGQKKNSLVLGRGLEALTILHEANVKTCFGSDLIDGFHPIQNHELLPLSVMYQLSATVGYHTARHLKALPRLRLLAGTLRCKMRHIAHYLGSIPP